jgi:hypothetical protein
MCYRKVAFDLYIYAHERPNMTASLSAVRYPPECTTRAGRSPSGDLARPRGDGDELEWSAPGRRVFRKRTGLVQTSRGECAAAARGRGANPREQSDDPPHMNLCMFYALSFCGQVKSGEK